MNTSHSLPSTVTNVSFSFLTSQDIRRISVKQIMNPVLLDDLNRPNIGGLYDPALGPSDRSDMYVFLFLSLVAKPTYFHSCSTCHLTYFTCPGHYGHIELPAPVFHPLFMGNMLNLLRGTCMFCHRFKMSRTAVCFYWGSSIWQAKCNFVPLAVEVCRQNTTSRAWIVRGSSGH